MQSLEKWFAFPPEVETSSGPDNVPSPTALPLTSESFY
jgi:hypothetical protein